MKEFYTISKNETTEIIEKKSKFIADIYPVKNVEEAENKICFCSWMYCVCILSKGSRKHCETPQRMSGT